MVFIDRDMPPEICEILEVHFAAIRPVLIGTALHYLSELKQIAKTRVKFEIVRRAIIMKENAEAIIQFLNIERNQNC